MVLLHLPAPWELEVDIWDISEASSMCIFLSFSLKNFQRPKSNGAWAVSLIYA